MPASFHWFTARGIIRHAEPSVKTHPEFGFLSRNSFGAPRLAEVTIDNCAVQLRPIRWMRGTVQGFPGPPISRLATLCNAIQENGVPRQSVQSVPKMPHPAEHHGETQAVGRRNDVRIANRAARLNHGGGPRPPRSLPSTREGTENVRSHN